MRAGWVLRYARALTLSCVALSLAVVAHMSAGGLLPDAWTFIVMLGLTTLVAGAWFGREASRTQIVSLLVVGQTVMHGVMTAVAGHVEGMEPSGAVAHSHAMEMHEHVHGAGLTRALEHLLEDMTPAHAPMALAHLLAAVATGIWLAQGERALWNLVALMARATQGAVAALLRAPQLILALPQPARPVEQPLGTMPSRLRLLSVTHVRRGPPAVLRAS